MSIPFKNKRIYDKFNMLSIVKCVKIEKAEPVNLKGLSYFSYNLYMVKYVVLHTSLKT